MSVNMYEISCPNCGVVFIITKSFNDRLIESKNTFFCPNGHPQSYKGETDRDKLMRTERQLSCVRNTRNELFRSNSALRGWITRKKNKAAAASGD